MKSKSNVVLNGASAFERKLNWLLFQQEIDHIWGGGPGEWRPGFPIHPVPITVLLKCHIPMFELRPIDEFNMLENEGSWATPFADEARCRPCQVWWKGKDPCWVCGQRRIALEPTIEDMIGWAEPESNPWVRTRRIFGDGVSIVETNNSFEASRRYATFDVQLSTTADWFGQEAFDARLDDDA